MLVQSDLAATLSAIAEQGPQGFYQGPVAEKLAAGVRDAGGIMTSDDLKSYQPVIRAPVRGNYRGYDIVSMPPPSSGGVVLLETLNILEGFPMPRHGAGLRAFAAPHDRGHEARLCRSRALSRRSRFHQCAGRDPDVEGIRRKAARRHRPRPRHAMDRGRCRQRRRAKAAIRRISRSSTAAATPSATPIRSTSPMAWASSPRAPACCSTTNSTISPPHPAPPTPSAWSDSRPICPAPASGRCRRCRRPSC